MTRLVLHFLGSKSSSASINHMTNTWVLRATLQLAENFRGHQQHGGEVLVQSPIKAACLATGAAAPDLAMIKDFLRFYVLESK
jgi:hypothetical protein